MSKGLEALQRLFDHNYGNDFYIKAEEDAEIIEKELKDYEETKQDLERVMKDYQDLGNSCYKKLKALEIIKESFADFHLVYEEKISSYFVCINHYSRVIAKEEYDLLKEVLTND